MNRGKLDEVLTRNGAEGWEVVGMAGLDKTVGLNGIVCVVRRAIVAPPPPEDTTEGWYPDPCGRWEIRHWTGAHWSAHVADSHTKKRGIDAPQSLPMSDWDLSTA